MPIPADGLIETAYPELVRSDEYIRFQCPTCGQVNGSNVFLDGAQRVRVCGECFTKEVI